VFIVAHDRIIAEFYCVFFYLNYVFNKNAYGKLYPNFLLRDMLLVHLSSSLILKISH
jgi:hypothetical protein